MIGTMTWRELMTPKPEASERFYGELFNWKIKTVPMGPSSTYRLLHAGEKQIGGIMMFDKPGIPPHWCSYVSVDDVDATANRAKQNGGTIAHPPTDIPDVGRFAVLLDPQGAVTVAFKSATAESPRRDERPAAGEFCWEQLNTTATDKGIAFYEKVYGWKTQPMGDMKVFQVGDCQVASVMQAPPGIPAHWLTYVVVPKLAAACERVKKLGGKVLMERIPVPGIGTYAVVQDDLGATLGLFESA